VHGNWRGGNIRSLPLGPAIQKLQDATTSTPGNAFAKLKVMLPKTEARTCGELRAAIGQRTSQAERALA
jgi:hypothetical protein